MEIYTIDIRSWTASFRFPNLISGFQPTLEVPPLSTVLGLINAAAGTYLSHDRISLGYYFEYASKAVDIETIYMINSNINRKPTNTAKSNVVKREFLYETFLRIYVTEKTIADYFISPTYPLVLGRQNDLATVDIRSLKSKKKLESVDHPEKIRGQIVPFKNHHLPGTIQALPKYFTNTIPRQNIGTEAYSVINYESRTKANCRAYRDTVLGEEVDIFFHELDFSGIR